MKAASNPKAIAWVQLGSAKAGPCQCEIEARRGQSYLVIALSTGRTHRRKIDRKLLLKLAPGQWEGVEYIYPKVIKLPGAEPG